VSLVRYAHGRLGCERDTRYRLVPRNGLHPGVLVVNTSIRLDPRLVDQAAAAAGLPPGTSRTATIRYALAKLAGLTDTLAEAVARIPSSGRASNTVQASSGSMERINH
jgi:hypothetical protein